MSKKSSISEAFFSILVIKTGVKLDNIGLFRSEQLEVFSHLGREPKSPFYVLEHDHFKMIITCTKIQGGSKNDKKH